MADGGVKKRENNDRQRRKTPKSVRKTNTNTHAHTLENRLSNRMAKEVGHISRVCDRARLLFQAK